MSQEKINKIKEALKSKTLPPNTRKSLESSLKKLVGDSGKPKDENIFQTGSEASKEYKDKNKQVTVYDVMTKTGLKNKELRKEYRKVVDEVNKNSDYTFEQKKSVISSVMTMDKKGIDTSFAKGDKIAQIDEILSSTDDSKKYRKLSDIRKKLSNKIRLNDDEVKYLDDIFKYFGIDTKAIKENNSKEDENYVIVQTWNGEGYSDQNEIVSEVQNKSKDYFKNYFLEQSLNIANDFNVDETEVDLEIKDFSLSYTIGDEEEELIQDYGSLQAIKLKDNSYAVLILTSINEVEILTKTEYDKFIKDLISIGTNLEDYENGKGRHFFDTEILSELSTNPYEESDIQLEILDNKTKVKKTVKKKEPKAKTEKTDDQISDFLKDCKKALSSADYKVSKIKTKSGSTKTVKRKVRNDNAILNSKMKSVAKTILKDIKETDEPERYKQAKDIVEIISEITKKLDKLVLNKSISELATIKKFFEKF